MNTHADKIQETKNQSVANATPQKQRIGESTFQFEDNRPEAIAQRKLQEMADNSPRAIQLLAIKEMANRSPKAKQAVQLQSMADNRPESIVQRVINIENPEAELPKSTEGMGNEEIRGLIHKLMPVHGVTIPSISGLELMHRGKKVTFNTWREALDEADRLGWKEMGIEKPAAPEIEAVDVPAPRVLTIASASSATRKVGSGVANSLPAAPKNITWTDLVLTKGAAGDGAQILGGPWINYGSPDGTVNYQCEFSRGAKKIQFQIHIHPQVAGSGIDAVHMKNKDGSGQSSLIPQAIFIMLNKTAASFKTDAKAYGEGESWNYPKGGTPYYE